MCIYCCTYIQLNDYWKEMFGLVINKKYYISINNWSELINQKSFTIKCMNNLIKDLHLEKEVSLFDEYIDENIDDNIWKQKNMYFDYCLEDCKKGKLDIVKSVGKIISTEIMDNIIESENDEYNIPINCKLISIKFLNCIQSAYETD